MGWVSTEEEAMFDVDAVVGVQWRMVTGADGKEERILDVVLRGATVIPLRGAEAAAFHAQLAASVHPTPILPGPGGTRSRLVHQPQPAVGRPPETGNLGG
jgi:hypothetical protein